jgi:putative ABC transport system substrate-binding protein
VIDAGTDNIAELRRDALRVAIGRGGPMTRRDFVRLLGGTAIAWPMAAAGQRAKLPTIGLMGSSSAADQVEWTTAFVQRLRELGWREGDNVAIEYRWGEARTDRYAAIAAEFVRSRVDVILTDHTPPTLAAKRATSTIPIVFTTLGDPLGSGIVASLARPGGNLTGLSSQAPDAAGKRLELLREAIPDLRRLAILADFSNPYSALDLSQSQEAARTLMLDVSVFDIRRPEDIDPAFAALRGRAQALYVIPVPLIFANRTRINSLALAARLPTMHFARESVTAGGLMSYGPNWAAMWRRSADLVDKILRGTKPADIPVEQPTEFNLVINLKTAEALGLTIPPTLLARAEEVIE